MLPISRRQLLAQIGTGLGTLGLASLLDQQGLLARGSTPRAPRPSHFKPRANHIIHLFMSGGPSQVDPFDPKPALTKFTGQKPPADIKTERRTGTLMQSPF